MCGMTLLPDIKHFYNKLTDSNISDDDYRHANNVWSKFECRNLGEYTDLYMKTDIILLAEIFEQFRVTSQKNYGLDSAHYYTLPGYTWDCMLKYTQVNLELLDDIDMIMFIERGIRGGLSQCSKRYAKANNKYMGDYDNTKEISYLMYYDINNQYGFTTCCYNCYQLNVGIKEASRFRDMCNQVEGFPLIKETDSLSEILRKHFALQIPLIEDFRKITMEMLCIETCMTFYSDKIKYYTALAPMILCSDMDPMQWFDSIVLNIAVQTLQQYRNLITLLSMNMNCTVL